ncbi:MAG: CPBP family intramembrane metalloprotease [Alphaproteobacteria bacterium]|nr:CPBP family intramembrane metalloprotease [Alphaproteobacteria bacterium]
MLAPMDRAPGWGPLKSLPTWLEMTIVIVIAFGAFIYSSTFYALDPNDAAAATGDDFIWLMITEGAQGAFLIGFLWARGWTPQHLGLAAPDWRDLRHGAALLIAVIALSWIAYYVAVAVRPELQVRNIDIDDGNGAPLAIALTFSAINASYEELFVCAYIVAVWRGADIWTAIALSSVLRLSYHLYQGPLAIVMIFPLGVVFAWYFASQRRLLPLVLAHAALDLLAFFQESA